VSEESRFIGSPRFVPVPVSMRGTTKSLAGRSPEQIAQDHSFVLELLFRVPSLSSPALALSGAGLTARVSSLFATSPGASTHLEGSHVLDTFRPQVLSTSRRLSPHSAFGLVSSRSRVQGALLVQGLPISAQRSCLVGTICPPAVASASRSPGRILTATAGALGFEAFIRAGARAPRGR